MKEFSVSMALVDFLPVILFAAASVLLQRDLYNKMSKGAFALFAAGTIDVICAGALKALYKLLYSLGACDFEPLNAMFFPVQSIGFLLAGIGLVAMLTHRQGENAVFAAAPALYRGTAVFVSLMVLGLGMMDAVLCVLSKKMKKPFLIAVFAVSFICCLGMGYLSTKSFDKSSMNWIAECVNIAGEGLFLLGAVLLHQNGLKELRLNGGKTK
ncbi:MAG: hypothetical protein K6A39_01030 [Clostridiales bacterium]|nr:hypothetical protein [Clostridiales bacterium]